MAKEINIWTSPLEDIYAELIANGMPEDQALQAVQSFERARAVQPSTGKSLRQVRDYGIPLLSFGMGMGGMGGGGLGGSQEGAPSPAPSPATPPTAAGQKPLGFGDLAKLSLLGGGMNLAAGLIGGDEEGDNRVPFKGVDLNKEMREGLGGVKEFGSWAVDKARKPVSLRSSYAQPVPGLSGVDPAFNDPSLLSLDGNADMPNPFGDDEVSATLSNFVPKKGNK